MVVPARFVLEEKAASSTLALLREIQRRPLLAVRHASQQALRAQVFTVHLPLGVKGVVAHP